MKNRKNVVGFFILCLGCLLIFFPVSAAQGATILIAVPDIGDHSKLDEAVQRISDNLGVDVNVDYKPQGRLCMPHPPDWWQSQYDAGELPDIYLLESTNISEVSKMNGAAIMPESVLADLTTTIQPYDSAMQAFSSSEGQLGVPVGAAYAVLVYNMDAFNNLGLEYPKNISWDQLVQDNKTLEAANLNTGIINDPIISATYGLNTIGSEGLLEVNEWRQFVKNYGASFDDLTMAANVYAGPAADIQEEINNGTTAVALTMTSALHPSNENEPPLGMSNLPYFDPNGQIGTGHAYGFLVSPKTSYGDLAWQVVAALAADPGTTEWMLSAGYIPPSEYGFSIMKNDPDMVAQYFPVSIASLEEIASQAVIWTFPQNLNPDFYTNFLVPEMSRETLNLANNNASLSSELQPLINLMEAGG